MALKRKPFQGIRNIIYFNWHFYVIASLVLSTLPFVVQLLPHFMQYLAFAAGAAALVGISTSLIVSFYIYDISRFYELNWLPNFDNKTLLNINAGFDETSELIESIYPTSQLTRCDFYIPSKHTEVSIKRARKAYPPSKNTIHVSTDHLNFSDASFDYVLVLLAAHEIRSKTERIEFFKELSRVTQPRGRIIVTEHLRDKRNFIAYTIGFFHFYSKSNWMHTFKQANLSVVDEQKISTFITTFILEKNANPH